MSTMFFSKTPGATVAESLPDEEPAVLMGDLSVPGWVQLPAPLGGARVRVTGHGVAPCPCGAAGGEAVHLVLDEPTGVRVAECHHGRGFMWYRPRAG